MSETRFCMILDNPWVFCEESTMVRGKKLRNDHARWLSEWDAGSKQGADLPVVKMSPPPTAVKSGE